MTKLNWDADEVVQYFFFLFVVLILFIVIQNVLELLQYEKNGN